MAEQAWLDQKARHSPKVLDCPKPGVHSPRRLLRPRRPRSPAEALKPVLGACSGRLCPLFQVVLGTGENQSSTKRSVGPPLQLSLHHPRKKKNASSSFPVNFTLGEGWWRSHAGASPSAASWKCLREVWAFCRAPLPAKCRVSCARSHATQ